MFVSAGLELDGGGRALAGRLLAAGSAAFAREHGIDWRLFSLGGLDGFAAHDGGLGALGGTVGGIAPGGAVGSTAPGGALGNTAAGEVAQGFSGRQGALAIAVWRRQLAHRRVACVYDLLGPARVQAWLPAPLRAPYLVAIYGIEVWRRLSGLRARALRRATIRLATSNHALAAARAANADFGPVEVLPLCLEERQPAGEVDAALLDRAGQGYLLIVGRMAATERYKGHDQLLQALPRLTAAMRAAGPPTTGGSRLLPPADEAAPPHPPAPGGGPPRLVVAGDGGDRPRLEALAAALGVSGQVLFTGFVSEATLAELYARAAAFAMPSRGEGFGLVYLEAMRAGKPCVAARTGAAAEIVVGGETGLLVDPLDVDEIAAALGRLLAFPAAARAMGEAGRRRLEQGFTPERFRARLWPLLDRLTGDPRGGGGAAD